MTGQPAFDPLMAAVMSSEMSRASHTAAENEREHMPADLVAARARAATSPWRREPVRRLLRRIFGRDR